MECRSLSASASENHISTIVEYLSGSHDTQIGSNGIEHRVPTPPARLSPERVGPSTHQFLADLFRQHVRDYESMNLVLNHLGLFCDTSLLQVRLNHRENLGLTPQEMFDHCVDRLLSIWPLDECVNPDMRQKLRTFDWRALWNAVMGEAFVIRHYQENPNNYGLNRRSGSQRWIIMGAAYADPADHLFGWDMMRYLEPIASYQAFGAEFSNATIEVRDILGEDVHWFTRSFFRHWDQAIQLLTQKHPQQNPNDICYIIAAFMRQGMSVVEIFRKYWYQAPKDGSSERFGKACEQAGKEFVDRQWRMEVDNPFGSPGAVPAPLHIRTILARCDYVRARNTYFETVSYFVDYIERDDLGGELIGMIVGSMKDWAVATGNLEMTDRAMEAFFEEENTLDSRRSEAESSQHASSALRVRHNPWRGWPLEFPPVILNYDLPDDLPEPVGRLSVETPEDDDTIEEEFEMRQSQHGRLRRFVNWMNPFYNSRSASPFHLADVELEAYGPKIDLQMVAHPCEPPQGDSCPICLEEFVQNEPSQGVTSTTGASKADKKSRIRSLRPGNILQRRQATKQSKSSKPMQFNLCNHIFHLGCMKQVVNQAYPRSDLVACPCCRTSICPARHTRAARRGFGRIPVIGRLSRF